VFRPGYFDVPAITATDRERTGLYQARTKRATLAAEGRRPEDYLRGLELRVAITEADAVTMPRLEQLLRRTNQFKMAEPTNDPGADRLVLGCEVADRFGRDGIVAGVWLARREDHWSIENMVMSCRVFARGIEHAILDHVIGLAVEAGVTRLAATFTATGRNQVGGRFYPEACFVRIGQTEDTTHYTMDLEPRPRLLPDWVTPSTESGIR
jgi:FkbH-like protein